MRLTWKSAPNEGETLDATRIEIKGRDLTAHQKNGAMMYTYPVGLTRDEIETLREILRKAEHAFTNGHPMNEGIQ